MTPHQKIMRAAKRGTGCRLTADEVIQLSMDDAVATRAANDEADRIESVRRQVEYESNGGGVCMIGTRSINA